ncbi:MAG TPA: helix-turn-helix domain-containing protein [Syntrophomonadaceae bacterium]|nr:helix-turn-helix domain-containing protein [Syntrophomonadaceae bacterium]
MSKDILYTADEIAQKLQITKGTVYEMIKRGDLDAYHIGRHIRVSAEQFEIFLIKSKGTENVYEAQIVKNEDETLAEIGSVKINVDTDFEGSVKIAIRPEDIILSKGTFLSSARNVHKGVITDITEDEGRAKVVVDIGIPIVALITKKSLDEMELENGVELYAIFKTMAAKVYR